MLAELPSPYASLLRGWIKLSYFHTAHVVKYWRGERRSSTLATAAENSGSRKFLL